ncbi:hypothetical protein [Streptomyces sp. SP18BB07]|uniref:cyanobactin maturation protease PatG family protein n=1 Tax=Streptomyces sp. SP18BB07 TaxID=3002522 RepID=UPI002E773F00|nr:hypothetical protein [Streptomyces sp. SP18BB07]MEE1766245.1 hypothetical protein [Streptomyces sp. SP18BB07]
MDPEITDGATDASPPPETGTGTRTRTVPAAPPASFDPDDAAPLPVESGVTQACCGCAGSGSHDGGGAGRGGDTTPGYVYVIGQVRAVFPDLSVQHEFLQAAGAGGAHDASDADAVHRVLSAPENRYLARQMCYVLSVQGVDTYVLEPVDPTDLDDLVEALRPVRDYRDLAVVVGTLGPLVPPGACQGLSVPVVHVEKIWAFDSRELIEAIDRPADTTRKGFEKTAREVLDRVLQLNNNAGLDPAHRALNYLTVREQEIYRRTSEMRSEGFVLSAVETGLSRLSVGSQTVITVVFSYTHRQTNVTEKWFVRVGLAGLFPFRVTPVQRYYTR